MLKISINGKVTCQTIENIQRQYDTSNIMIVLENTKYQAEEELRLIAQKYPNVMFSVIGGLNPKKTKYNNEHYQKRTYLTSMELSKIVKIYRDIEKNIDLSWSETAKAMYIYKCICDRMEYSELNINGKDYSRSLAGLLYGQAVCVGFALMYKEALDRLGIECHYQNRKKHHSWNIAKLDGQYRALELTWDTYNKTNNGCAFYYFNRDNESFYDNPHHDISHETEEKKFPIVPYSNQEMNSNYATITKPKALKYQPDSKGQVNINIKGEEATIYVQDNYIRIKIANQPYQTFYRKNGTNFIIIEGSKISNGLNGHLYIDFVNGLVRIAKIYSEEQLIRLSSEYNETLANGLLGSERITRKVNNFNGYVGYIGTNHGMYYNNEIESKLNMRR